VTQAISTCIGQLSKQAATRFSPEEGALLTGKQRSGRGSVRSLLESRQLVLYIRVPQSAKC